MAITNQQIADWLKENCEAQRNSTQMFTATVDRFIEHDRENHKEFRTAITQLQSELAHHGEFIKQARMILVAAVVLPVLTQIVAYFINTGG